MKLKPWQIWTLAIIASLAVIWGILYLTDYDQPALALIFGKKTVQDRVSQYGGDVKSRLAGDFAKAGVDYPPKKLVLLALKDERRLDLYAGPASDQLRLVRSYNVLAASGGLGPKLQRGDAQVPEGVYAIQSLNANSRFHLALRLNYPNAFDQDVARREKRTDLGADIMIHGRKSSVGCLAMGNDAIEDLFVLTALTGIENVTVVIAPVDFRKGRIVEHSRLPWKIPWLDELYGYIKTAMTSLPIKNPPPGASTVPATVPSTLPATTQSS